MRERRGWYRAASGMVAREGWLQEREERMVPGGFRDNRCGELCLSCCDVIESVNGEMWLTPKRNAIGHTHTGFKRADV
jgi:hypothetical protein